MNGRASGAMLAVVCVALGCTTLPRDVDDDDGSSTETTGQGGTTGVSTGGIGGIPTTGNAVGGNTGNGGSAPGMCDGGPLATPLAGCTPTPVPNTGDFHQDCVDRINQFRWDCQCLPPLQRWTAAESCTDQQSADDQNGGGAHGNFGACGENAQNTCPNWGSEGQVVDGCLQMMWDEGPGQPFSEHGHYLNMSSTQYSRVACGRAAGGAGVWSNQNFSN